MNNKLSVTIIVSTTLIVALVVLWYVMDVKSSYTVSDSQITEELFEDSEINTEEQTTKGIKESTQDIGDRMEFKRGFVYEDGQWYVDEELVAIDLNPHEFEILGYGIIKDSSKVYFPVEYSNEYTLLEGVDASTFEFIGECECVETSCASYYKDSLNIYVEDLKLAHAESSSFEYFGEYILGLGLARTAAYARDNNDVFVGCGRILQTADPASFTVIGNDHDDAYAKDIKKVYFGDEIVIDADPKTFETIDSLFWRDEDGVYVEGQKLVGVDVETFETVGPYKGWAYYFSKDKNSVYNYSNLIEGVSPELCTSETLEMCLGDTSN